MPLLQRDDGVKIHWEARGTGTPVVVSLIWFGYPEVFEGLIADLATDHRVIVWDPRGTGRSTRAGPYDIATDAADLGAVVEAAGGPAVLVDFTAQRSIRLAAHHAELVDAVVITGSNPGLGGGEIRGGEGLAASGTVVDALQRMLETDYRAALRTIVTSTNAQMDEEQIRKRVDRIAEHCSQESSVGRMRAVRDTPSATEAASLGASLTIVSFDTPWFPAKLLARTRELLPEAQVIEAEDGPISRPDITAGLVRRITHAAGGSTPRV